MKTKIQIVSCSVILSFLIPFFAQVCPAADHSAKLNPAGQAIHEAMAELGVRKGDGGLLLLTNAYYGRIDDESAEQYRDLFSDITGCTSGKKSLLDVHTPVNEHLWFALCKKSSDKVVFCRRQGGSFQKQIIDGAPGQILEVEAWKRASDGSIGPKTLFRVMSISLAWSAGTDWSILKVAGFHGQIAPGINIGYLFHRYLEKKLPLEKGDEYLFFGALPKCYMDTLQIVYDTTLGKELAYGLAMSKEQLMKYRVDGAMPCVAALAVNESKNTCRGMVLGFSRKRVMDDLGVREADLNPKGGESNPVFCIARIKACRQMAKMKPEQQMRWVVEMRRFSGDRNLVSRVCNAGGDPYAIVWAK
jgi:formylmethanofuran dehydrogenase subunit E-like metal-binding protein